MFILVSRYEAPHSITGAMERYTEWIHALHRAKADALRPVQSIEIDLGNLEIILGKAAKMKLPNALEYIDMSLQRSSFSDTTWQYLAPQLPVHEVSAQRLQESASSPIENPSGMDYSKWKREFKSMADAVHHYVYEHPSQKTFNVKALKKVFDATGGAPIYNTLTLMKDLKEVRTKEGKTFVRI